MANKPVLGEHTRVGEPVEQRRLSGVGVADDRHGGQTAACPALALQVAVASEVLELGLEARDAAHDPPPVDFDLGLAAAEASADAAALLRQLGVGTAAQPGQPVAEHRQLDLRLALQGVGVLAEDVEDHRRAVDGRATEQLLQVVLLGGRQLVVEHDGVGVEGEAHLAELLGLALAEEPRVVGRIAALHDTRHLVGPGRVDEQGQLVEAGLELVVARSRQRDADEHDALTDGTVDQRGAECFVVRRAHGRNLDVGDVRGRTGERGTSRDGMVDGDCRAPAVHVHTDFAARSTSPHLLAATAAAHRTGAACGRDPSTSLVDPHRDRVRLRALAR